MSESFLHCYQCDNDWEDDDCWKEDSGNYGRKIECGPEYDACAKSDGGKQKIVVHYIYEHTYISHVKLDSIYSCFLFYL